MVYNEALNDGEYEIIKRAYRDPVFFAEHFLYNEQGKKYKLDEHQKRFLRDRSNYRVLFWGRRLGKTTVFSMDNLHKLIFQENYKQSIVAPTRKQVENISDEMSGMIRRSPFVSSFIDKDNVFKKTAINGNKITLDTAGKHTVTSLIGSGVNNLNIDEAQSMEDELFYQILPIIRGQYGDSKLTLSGTPRGREGFFYNAIQDAFRVIEDNGVTEHNPKGIYSLHRKPSVYLDEDDQVIKTGTKRLKIEEMKHDQRSMPNIKFKREYALQFVDSIGEVYPKDLIKECLIGAPPEEFRSDEVCVGGIDFGKTRNNSVLKIGEVTGKDVSIKGEDIAIKFIKTWPLGTRYKEITEYLINELPKRFPKFRKLCPDATGVGQSIIENLEDVTSYEIDPVVFSAKSKVDLVEYSVSKMENSNVKFIYDKKFYKEMVTYQRDVSKDDKVLYKKGESDDYVDAFILCMHAEKDYKTKAEPTIYSMGSKLTENHSSMSIKNKLLNKLRRRGRI